MARELPVPSYVNAYSSATNAAGAARGTISTIIKVIESMYEYIGWIYTILTVIGSINMTTRGESKIAWFLYVIGAAIGIVYFILVQDESQISLVAFFCIMNIVAIVRLHVKGKKKLSEEENDILNFLSNHSFRPDHSSKAIMSMKYTGESGTILARFYSQKIDKYLSCKAKQVVVIRKGSNAVQVEEFKSFDEMKSWIGSFRF